MDVLEAIKYFEVDFYGYIYNVHTQEEADTVTEKIKKECEIAFKRLAKKISPRFRRKF